MSGDIIRDALAASKTPEGIARRIDNIGVVGYVSPSIRKVLDSVARDVRALVPAATRRYLTSAEVVKLCAAATGDDRLPLTERYADVYHETGRGFYVVDPVSTTIAYRLRATAGQDGASWRIGPALIGLLDEAADALDRAYCTGVLDPATGILQHPGETCPVCPNTETEPLEWVEINGGIDRQTDLPGPFYAQIGPEGSGGWSWTILDCRDGVEVASGRAPNEAEAERAVVMAVLNGGGS